MSAEPPAIPANEPAPPRPPRRHRWLLRVAIGLALLVLLAVGAVVWVFTTPQGARLVLDQAVKSAGEGVRLEGVEGRLGGVLRIKTIEVSRADMYARIEDFEMDTEPFAPLRGTLQVNRLVARSVELRTVSTEATARVPSSFAPPYPVRLLDGRVGELRKGTLTPEAQAEKDPARKRAIMDASRAGDFVVKNIVLQGGGDQREWNITRASAETAYGKGSVSGRLANTSPFAVELKAALEGVAAERAYRADVVAGGTLAAIEVGLDAVVSGQRATGKAKLEPFSKMPVRSVELRAAAVDLSQQALGPKTALTLEVSLAAESQASFAGPIRIVNAEPGPWDQQRLPFTSAAARVVVTQDRVDVTQLSVALLGGGSASGKASVKKSGIEADLNVADVDLAALHRSLQKTKVTGRVAVSGDKASQRFEVALKDPRFQVEGRAALAAGRLDVETVRIGTGGGAVTAKGTMALAGRKEFHFVGRAEHFDPSAFVKTTKGDLNFAFDASGTMADGVSGQAKLDIAPSTYAGLPASGRIDIAGDARRIARADVAIALGEARLTAKGAFGRAGDAMDVTFRAPNLAALGKPFGVVLAGRMEGEAHLTGTFEFPAGRVALTGANLALPSDTFVRELAVRGEAGSQPDSPIEVAVQARGVALGKQSPPTPLAETLVATLKGTRLAHRLAIDATMARDTTVKAAFQGGLDERAKQPTWSGRVESLALTGRGAFSLQAPAPLTIAATQVELGEALLRGTWGEARLAVTRWTPRTLDLRGSTAGIEIQNLARSLRLGTLPRSNLVIAGDWDVRAAESFNGSLNFHRVSGDVRVGEPPLALGLQDMVLKVDVVGGRARGTVNVAGERVGRVQGSGTAMIVRGATGWELAPDAPVQARLTAENTNLESLAPLLGADARLGGRLNASVVVSGTGADPRVSGEARAQDLVLREPQSGFEIENGQVAMRMSGRSLTIEQFTATTPWNPAPRARESFQGTTIPASGTLSAEGSVDLAAGTGALRVRADHAVVTQTPGRFAAVSGEASLEARKDGMLVSGTFKVDGGWIGALDTPLPTVSEDVVVVRAAKPVPEEAAAKPGERIVLDMRIALGDRMYLQGRGLDTRLAGELHITGTPGAGMRAMGTIRTEGGIYKGYGQNLAIERGVLQFSGPIDNPRLNVLAVRKGLAVEPGVEVLGTSTRPRVRLVSTPDVPEPDKLSWLVLGRGPSELAPGDASVLLAAASSMFGGNNPGSDLGKKFGLDEVKIGRADTNSILGVLPQSTVAGKTGSASAAEVVSVGKRIRRDVYLTYEQGLADAEGTLKIAWQISRHFQLLARAGYLPGLDAVYRWTFK